MLGVLKENLGGSVWRGRLPVGGRSVSVLSVVVRSCCRFLTAILNRVIVMLNVLLSVLLFVLLILL